MTGRIVTIPTLTILILGSSLFAATAARAEYRAYELEIVDVYECRIKEEDPCRRNVVRTSLSLDLYTRTHGGADRLGVIMLATWMCYGDTSNFRDVCPRPAPRNGRFSAGDRVKISLTKHITEGWEGTVEVAYFQRSVSSNVYGVRFAERQNVYARYFEKDLRGIEAPEPEAEAGGEPPAEEPQGEPPQ